MHKWYILLVAVVVLLATPVAAVNRLSVSEVCGAITMPVVTPDQPFVGRYDGSWSGKIPHTLLINAVNQDGTVEGYYVVEAYAPWKVNPACRVVNSSIGTIDGNRITLRFNDGAVVIYDINGSHVIASFTRKGRVTPGKLSRSKN